MFSINEPVKYFDENGVHIATGNIIAVIPDLIKVHWHYFNKSNYKLSDTFTNDGYNKHFSVGYTESNTTVQVIYNAQTTAVNRDIKWIKFKQNNMSYIVVVFPEHSHDINVSNHCISFKHDSLLDINKDTNNNYHAYVSMGISKRLFDTYRYNNNDDDAIAEQLKNNNVLLKNTDVVNVYLLTA
jgi:hypothetical protein